jgi:hypothetical protein
MSQQRNYIQLMFNSNTSRYKTDILILLHDHQYDLKWNNPGKLNADSFNFLVICPKQKVATWKTIQTEDTITVVDGGFIAQYELIHTISPLAAYEWLIGG